ncbi:MAG: 1,2-phenylacetyl-CoA epoxidase, subunit C [Phycisphaerae bacterium]|nr:1,2-phenylacetyl-CoA epoxidase, subunit C [Phycisphaerae bacterium]
MTPSVIENAGDLSGPLRAAVIELLYWLADNDLVMGHRNSEWTGLGPILEADIAFSSMAQDEMGHALAYYQLLHDLGERDPDSLAFVREPREFRCAALVCLQRDDWAFSLVRQFLYDSAEHVRLTHLASSAYQPLASLARKLVGEEKYHLMHGRSWIERLGRATDESRARLAAAMAKAAPHAAGLFEAGPHDALLAQAGILPSERALWDEWRDSIAADLSHAELAMPGRPPVLPPAGRFGLHPADLAPLLEAMQRVYRLDPTAAW